MIVNSFSELIAELELFKKKNNLIFRGQSNKDWALLPKSGRSGFSSMYTSTISEEGIFRSWKRYAKNHLTSLPDNDWDWLAIAQHHGLATRLLDWSKNPLVASYFACVENPLIDGVVYYYPLKEIFDFNKKETSPFKLEGFNVLFPSGLVSRIINQRGLFTTSDKPNIDLKDQLGEKLESIIIPSFVKREILTSLDFYGINAMSLFHDLDSLSNYLNQYVTNTYRNNNLATELIIVEND